MALNNFFNNLFGTIGRRGIFGRGFGADFIPKDSTGKIIKLTDHGAVWIGLASRIMQLYAYDFCYPVAAVADRLAEYDLAGKIEILNSQGKGKDNIAKSEWANNMNRLIAQPNPLQTWAQFRGQQLVYKRIFGFCPVLPVLPIGFENQPAFAQAMYNLPPWFFNVFGTKKYLSQTDVKEMVKHYTITLLGSTFEISPDKIFILTDSFMQDESYDYLLPKSRLVGLDMAVSNVCAAMEADNVLLRKKGPMGFIGPDAAAMKDGIAGYIPMTKKEKEEIQDDYSQYGLEWNQWQAWISKVALRWNPMSYDVRQLMTKETVVAGEKAICHRFGFPYVLYEEVDATYANGANAKKGVYQDIIIPNSEKDLHMYNKFFKAEENKAVITSNFTEVAAFQEDEKFRGQGAKAMDDALEIEFRNNVITLNQWRVARDIDTTPDGDVYFKDTQPKVLLPTNGLQQHQPALN